MKEKTKFIPALMSLTAALITCTVTILNKYEALEAMLTIFAVLVIFYVLGLIIKFWVEKNFIIEETEEELQEEIKEEDMNAEETKDIKETEKPDE